MPFILKFQALLKSCGVFEKEPKGKIVQTKVSIPKKPRENPGAPVIFLNQNLINDDNWSTRALKIISSSNFLSIVCQGKLNCLPWCSGCRSLHPVICADEFHCNSCCRHVVIRCGVHHSIGSWKGKKYDLGMLFLHPNHFKGK